MWIVKLALARPYTCIVFSLVLLLICLSFCSGLQWIFSRASTFQL